jgi:hypothetical protein
VRWSGDAWQSNSDLETTSSGLTDLFHADLPTADLPVDTMVEFTFRWLEASKWEGQNFRVTIA